MNNILCEDKIIIADINSFEPDVTFDCGQCFRWEKIESGEWCGIACGHSLTVTKTDTDLLISGTDKRTFDSIFRTYFDLDRDYAEILQEFSKDPVLREAMKFAPGIRILHQDSWEALCSFIISQNNNIPRIKGIVSRLCEHFGKPCGGGFSFPSAKNLADLEVSDLSPLRSGFRAKYILDAAKKVASGEVILSELEVLPLDEARQALMTIKGVGPKVADCALLFGCGRLDAFPQDVWIKRVLARFYPKGFPENLKAYGGIAQQFLFHYARCCENISKTF